MGKGCARCLVRARTVSVTGHVDRCCRSRIKIGEAEYINACLVFDDLAVCRDEGFMIAIGGKIQGDVMGNIRSTIGDHQLVADVLPYLDRR